VWQGTVQYLCLDYKHKQDVVVVSFVARFQKYKIVGELGGYVYIRVLRHCFLQGNLELLVEDTVDALLFVVLLAHPELLAILHDLSEHGTSEEHHVLSARRVLNAALELGELGLVSLQHSLEVEVLDLAL